MKQILLVLTTFKFSCFNLILIASQQNSSWGSLRLSRAGDELLSLGWCFLCWLKFHFYSILYLQFLSKKCGFFFGYNLRNHKPANKSAICNRSICFPNAIAKVTHSTGGVCVYVFVFVCACVCVCFIASNYCACENVHILCLLCQSFCSMSCIRPRSTVKKCSSKYHSGYRGK